MEMRDGCAKSAWLCWLQWASASGLGLVEKAAAMARMHPWSIVTTVVLNAANGSTEGGNSRHPSGQGPAPRPSQPGLLRRGQSLPPRRPRPLSAPHSSTDPLFSMPFPLVPILVPPHHIRRIT